MLPREIIFQGQYETFWGYIKDRQQNKMDHYKPKRSEDMDVDDLKGGTER